MLNLGETLGGFSHLLHAIGCDAQIHVAVDNKGIIAELRTAIVVIKDQVDSCPIVRLAKIHVAVGHSVHRFGATDQHSRPAAEDLGITPGIHRQFVPAGLVVDIHHIAVVLDGWRDRCSSPTGDTDRITLAKLRIFNRMRYGRSLYTELLADKQKSVCQRFAGYKIFGIEIDTELGVVVLRLGENEVGILVLRRVHPVERTYNVNLIFG